MDLVLQLSVQEEVGGRGAVIGAYRIHPDYAVVVDVTFGRQPDTPDVRIECGKGAAIGIGPNMNHALTQQLFRISAEKGIPSQPEVCPGSSGTNAEDIQISREGVATALVSLPIRYMHTPAETVRTEDMESVLALVTELARTLE